MGRERDLTGPVDEEPAVLGALDEGGFDLGLDRVDLGQDLAEGVGVEGVLEHEEPLLVVGPGLFLGDDPEGTGVVGPREAVVQGVRGGHSVSVSPPGQLVEPPRSVLRCQKREGDGPD